ncbi:hypothetical protein [Pseudomonas phage vB_PaeP_YA3]|nr:hypothetical protein [Pseudomonas phage vB_PaeP_YA3]
MTQRISNPFSGPILHNLKPATPESMHHSLILLHVHEWLFGGLAPPEFPQHLSAPPRKPLRHPPTARHSSCGSNCCSVMGMFRSNWV